MALTPDPSVSARFAFDARALDGLRLQAKKDPDAALKQAATQFEAVFVRALLKSMREATPSDGMLSSSQEKTYTSMLDQQLSQNLSGRGLGLAEAMFTQLSRTMGGDALALAPATAAGGQMPGATLPGMPLMTDAKNQSPMMPLPKAVTPALTRVPDLSFYEKATAQATLSRSVLPQAQVEQFVSRMLPAAQRASQASGVPAQLIMAQAALESGWGKREIRSEDGKTSFNMFGIKADKNWKGPVVEATTTEYVNGVAQKTQARFRAYGSYEESFADYARFLTSNPRYANVLATPDAAAAAHGLQRAGYATDPNYGGKLVRIMEQMT